MTEDRNYCQVTVNVPPPSISDEMTQDEGNYLVMGTEAAAKTLAIISGNQFALLKCLKQYNLL